MNHKSQERLPYEEVTNEEYAVQAARTFRVERVAVGLTLLHGPCPRCTAQITSPMAKVVYRDDRPEDDDARFHVVFCTCGHPHPGRPEERVGCGAYWGFLLEETSS